MSNRTRCVGCGNELTEQEMLACEQEAEKPQDIRWLCTECWEIENIK